MAEGGTTKPMDEYGEEMTTSSGPTNIREARAYENKLDDIFENFKTLLKEDKRNALKSTSSEVKQHMARQFSSMSAADIDIVMACIKDHTCIYMRNLEHQEGARSVDPDDDIPLGPEVLEQLPPEKRYTKDNKRQHYLNLHSHSKCPIRSLVSSG